MKRRLLSVVCIITLILLCIGCSTDKKSTNEKTPSKETASGNGEIKENDFVIGLSNSYFGNAWRKQMVDSFTAAAEEAKEAGYISDYEVQNGDGTANAQIAQINSFILSGVDAICICAASPTALNSTIQKALDAGIIVISFDNVVDMDGVYNMDYDWLEFGKTQIDFIADRLGGKGNLLAVRGIPGAYVDQKAYEGWEEGLKKYPDLKVVQEVVGEANATKAQDELIKVMASLPEIDAVLSQGGDSIGVVNAFTQSGKEFPLIIGDNSAEFINWWLEQDNYETFSHGATPGCGSAALWVSLYVLNGYDVPYDMIMEIPSVTIDSVEQYKGLSAGTFVTPEYGKEKVLENIIEPAK